MTELLPAASDSTSDAAAPGITVVRDDKTGQLDIVLDRQSGTDLLRLLDALPAGHDYGTDLGLYDDGDQISYTIALLQGTLNKVVPFHDR